MKEIPGCPGYFAEASGQIYSSRAQSGIRPLKPYLKKPNRTAVTIDGKALYVHVLVCTAFHGHRPVGKEVRHLDGNSLNNCADNLTWGTKLENAADDRRLGVRAGKRYPRLTEADVEAIVSSDERTGILVERFGVTADTIRAIRSGRSRKKKVAA